MRKSGMIVAGAGVVALAGAAAFAQPGGGEATAVYWMTADTMSGMGGMMGRGAGSMIGAMMRGGSMSGTARTLRLQLGSSRRAAGVPQAEHLPPAGLQAGQSLPLVSPEAARAVEEAPTAWPKNMERPKGRILIYWGCGEHARPGQPVVIDFESVSQGRLPPAFANLATMRSAMPPSPSRFATYGDWPNQRNSTRIQPGGSLVGEHVVRGNYTPDIRFTVAPNQDFLAPVTLTSTVAAPSGAVPLVWQPVGGARGWLATAMGAGAGGDMVMWTSSETQAMAMGMDHMSDGEIARLVQQRVLMPGSADRCTVPTEVAHGGRGAMLTLTAFGGESNFSNPVRPARAPAGWHPDWVVKLRTKSTYMGLLGVDMPQMAGEERGGGQNGNPPAPKKKKSLFDRAIGGMIPH
jgi:hypothetical protein